jgi:hypothetical protein
MIDEKQKALIEEALSNLSQADTDHWCDSSECNIDTPCCSAMHNRAAARKLRALIDAEMVSLHPNRLTNPAERIYFDAWVKENIRHGHVNGNHTALELILCPPKGQPVNFVNDGKVPRPSQRDAEVATAIIQWLGTNCGHGFVLECERRIDQERAERSQFGVMSDRFSEWRERDLFQRMLDAVLKDVLPSPAKGAKTWTTDSYGLAKLRSEINRVLQTNFMLFAFASGKASLEVCAKSLGLSIEEFRKLNDHANNAVDDRLKRLAKREAKSA